MQAAVRAYQAGNLDEALRMAKTVSGQSQPMAQALIGNILAKRGDRTGAANAFVLAAAGNPEQGPVFLKLAVTLLQQAGDVAQLRTIALKAALANKADAEFVFSMAEVVVGPWDAKARKAARSLIEYLDRNSGPAMFFALNLLQIDGDLQAIDTLLAEVQQSLSDDVVIACFRFASAHDRVDLETIAEHQAMMRQPDAPFARAVLERENALPRLLWSEDEALNARPNRESHALAASFAARPAQRRALCSPDQPLHIGYLSSDFSAHATMTLFLDGLVAHDRTRFQITLFCHTDPKAAESQSQMPEVLRREIVSIRNLSDADAAAAIDRSGVDILVDLKGHTPGARLAIVNLSNAPIKATWLGYPGAVNGVDLDYVISDPIVTPDSAAGFYQEKLCRLPETYQPNSTTSRPAPKPSSRKQQGLPEDAFVFASFNGAQKITPQTVELWCRILAAVPDSLLWVLTSSAVVQRNLRHALSAAGLDPARLLFADRQDYLHHVDRLPLADLALDTFPYNGHTTTSDMLWAGLPVLTKKGTCFAARVSESLLNAIGLGELVANDADAFVDLAVSLASNPERMAAVKHKLGHNRLITPLFDTPRFTRHLERAYEMMADRARQNLPPATIDVPALPHNGV